MKTLLTTMTVFIGIYVNLSAQTAYDFNISGIAKYDGGQYEAAIKDYRQAIQVDPSFHAAYHNIGLALEKLGKYDEAIASYNEAIRVNPRYKEAFRERGRMKEMNGLIPAAIIDYSRAIELDPDFAVAFYNRGNARREMGLYYDAIEDFTTAINLKYELSDTYNERGRCKHDLGKYEAAIEDFNSSLSWDPKYVWPLHNIALCMKKLGRYEEAVEYIDKAIAVNPSCARCYQTKGLIKEERGQYVSAIEDYNKSLTFDSQDPNTFINRGLAREALGQFDEAISDYTMAISLNPKEGAVPYRNRGLIKFNRKQYNAAIEDFNKSIETDPEYAEAYNSRGYTFQQMNNYVEARKDFERTLSISPTHNLAYNNLENLKKIMASTSQQVVKPIEEEARVWAVAVGINVYLHEFKLSPLRTPESSAFQFAGFLERKGFTDNEEIPVLRGPNARKDLILAKLNKEFCNTKVKANDLVIFFFSGHGASLDGKIGVCPYDFFNAQSLINDNDILDIMRKSPARHKVCFIEACKSEVNEMSLSPSSIQKFHQERNKIGGGIVFITSTMPTQKSYEDPTTGGYFSYYLLEGIKGLADTNKDQVIKTKELFDYIKQNVVARTNNDQIPQINPDGYTLDIPIMVIE